MKFSKAEWVVLTITMGVLAVLAICFLQRLPDQGSYAVAGQHPPRAQPTIPQQTFVPDQLVDLNTADYDALLTLPGIGETRAKAILQDRAENGAFASPQEVTRVPGIGQSVFEQLAPYITVSTPSP